MRRILISLTTLLMLTSSVWGQQKEKPKDEWDFRGIKPITIHSPHSNWKQYATARGATFYYNWRTLIKKGNRVKVWDKNVGDKEGYVENLRRHNLSTTKYEDFAFAVARYEFDCTEQSYRILAFAEYDSKGNVIYSQGDEYGKWSSVIPDSITDKLFNAVCSSKR